VGFFAFVGLGGLKACGACLSGFMVKDIAMLGFVLVYGLAWSCLE